VYTNEPRRYGNLVSQRRLTGGVWTPHWYAFDAIGSTRELTTSSQVISDTRHYDAWGQLVATAGTTLFPFAFVAECEYRRDNDSSLDYVRARVYLPQLARWASLDPSVIRDSLNLFQYTQNRPLHLFDPSGLITIKPVAQNLGMLGCGERAWLQWDFEIDFVDPKSKKRGAPCDGWLIQHVMYTCIKKGCRADRPTIEHNEYSEKWPVAKDDVVVRVRDENGFPLATHTDQASVTLEDSFCGYYHQTGEVRLYCKRTADVPQQFRESTSGVGELEGWRPGEIGRVCDTGGGLLPILKGKPPAFWTEKNTGVDGRGRRSFWAVWNCCNMQPPGGNASGAPRLVDDFVQPPLPLPGEVPSL
jgi:RHS repeat-associated protein